MKSIRTIVREYQAGMKIRCGICNKPVDRFVVEVHEDHMSALKVKAYCHGDKDDMLMTLEFLEDTPDLDAQLTEQEGVAFSRQMLS